MKRLRGGTVKGTVERERERIERESEREGGEKEEKREGD